MPDPFRLKSTYRYGIASSLQSGNFPIETIFDSNESSGKYSGIYETLLQSERVTIVVAFGFSFQKILGGGGTHERIPKLAIVVFGVHYEPLNSN